MAGLRKLTTYKKAGYAFPYKGRHASDAGSFDGELRVYKSYSPFTTSPGLNQYFGLAEPTL